MNNSLATTQGVLDDFCAWLQDIFEGTLFETTSGERRALNIFAQNTPAPTGNDEDPDPELTAIPYGIVHLTGGKINTWTDPQTVEMILLFCTHDASEDHQGYRDILTIKEKILERLLKNTHVGSSEVVLPIEWTMNETDYHPFYFGALQFNIETHRISSKEDKFA